MTAPTKTGAQPVILVDDDGNMVSGDAMDAIKRRQTYYCAFSVVPAATPTDIVEIIGVANKIVEVVSLRMTGVIGTSIGVRTSTLRRSTLNTGGSSTTPTIVAAASSNTAASAVVKAYTANPSGLGTLVGSVSEDVVTILGSTATTYRTPNELLLGRTDGSQGVMLLSATETLCVNLQSLATPPTRLDFSIVFREYTAT